MLVATLPQKSPIITSTLKRTQQTADALEEYGLDYHTRQTSKSFNEQNFGDWEEMTYDAQYLACPQFWENPIYNRPPNGESFADLVKRVGSSILRYGKKHAKNANNNVIIITHAGVIRACLYQATHQSTNSNENMDLLQQALHTQIAPLSLSCFTYESQNHRLHCHAEKINLFPNGCQ